MIKMDLRHGDCLEVMKDIPDKSIDMILCDLPYGTTACYWDTIIPFEPLWQHYERLIKDFGAIVLFASQPFTSKLILSNIELFKYQWVWKKSKGCNFVHAKNMPIKTHEDICVFSKGKTIHASQSSQRMPYNVKIHKHQKNCVSYNDEHGFTRPSHKDDYVQEYTNYPTSMLEFDNSNQRGLHPTQKPTQLLEYLIKTYTEEGETILDNCMGSGSTGVACRMTNRNFIGIEQEQKYFDLAKKRLNEMAVLPI
jgi:site-specific DNA-methyltransferase (adenine-specific)